jgi:hypothetical protein
MISLGGRSRGSNEKEGGGMAYLRKQQELEIFRINH